MPAAAYLTSLLLAVPLVFGASLFGGDDASEYEDEHTAWVYPPWEHTWGVVRATETHLDFFTFGRATFRNPQGLAAVRLTATDDPDKRGDDDEITVYGINSGENSIIYNRSMHSIGLYGYGDDGAGNLDAPWDVAATPGGLVFVTDSGNRRVVKLRNVDGALRYEMEFGRDGDGVLALPRGIAVTGEGRVVVADAGADRVAVFDTSGVFHYAIGGFDRPVGLAAVDSADGYTRPPRAYIAVTDSGGTRLRKLGFDGVIIAERDISHVAGRDGTYAGHVATDLYHNVVVTDSANCRLLKFDPHLNLLAAWGREGDGRTRFRGPTGITIWRRFGQTFVAHATGAHYLWVGIDLSEPPELEQIEARTLLVNLNLSERAYIVLELVDEHGEVVRSQRAYRDVGKQGVRWPLDLLHYERTGGDPTPELVKPDPLPGGSYTLRLRLRATYSSRKAFERVMERRIDLPPQPASAAGQ
ncbi:MAG: hypothetical protein MAG453_00306 [Calditrichaeota bacterium]|nr:hypothetical protein [Calditrichota bacterium]